MKWVGADLPTVLYNLLERESCCTSSHCFIHPHLPYPNVIPGLLLFLVPETFMEVLFFSNFQTEKWIQMVWIWLTYSSFVCGWVKLLHVLRGLVLPDDGCSVGGHTLHAQKGRHKGGRISSWANEWLKNMIRNWKFLVAVSLRVEAHWDMFVSEITEETVMVQPPGIYHKNVLCDFAREIKTQRKTLCMKIWLSN